MELMKNYNNALQALYDHVGFKEDWAICPIDDSTDCFWVLDENQGFVRFADTMETLNSDGDYYEDEIYKQRFYTKHVYCGENLTMVFCDTHTDGMKYFRFFDNSKEVKNGK